MVTKQRCRKDQNSPLTKQHPLKQIYSFKVTPQSVLLSSVIELFAKAQRRANERQYSAKSLILGRGEEEIVTCRSWHAENLSPKCNQAFQRRG